MRSSRLKKPVTNRAYGSPLTAAGPFGTFTQFPFTLYSYRHPLAYIIRTELIVARSDFLVNSPPVLLMF